MRYAIRVSPAVGSGNRVAASRASIGPAPALGGFELAEIPFEVGERFCIQAAGGRTELARAGREILVLRRTA